MMKHGGIYHHYYRTDKTTHVIATNLPDTKVRQLKNMNVVKPEWIVESIAAGKLLDYRQYLLYTRQSKNQPKLVFKDVPRSSSMEDTVETEGNNQEESSTNNMSSSDNQSEKNTFPLLHLNTNSFNKAEENEEIIKSDSIAPGMSKSSIKTASETGFLSEFYSNSRLHHISTMGATFKQYVNDLREKSSGEFPGVEKCRKWKVTNQQSSLYNPININYKNIIMHIDMDCFFVSVGLRKRPELKNFPVAVTHAKAGGENNHRSGMNRKAEFELYKTRREEKIKGKHPVSDASEDIDVKPWSDWVEAIDEFNSMSEIASCNYEARQKGLKNGMFLGQALKLCPNLKTIPYDFEGYKEVSYCLYNTVAR